MKNKTKRNARANTIYVISVCSGHFYWARSIALQIYRIYVFWAEGARTEDVLWNLHVRRFFFYICKCCKTWTNLYGMNTACSNFSRLSMKSNLTISVYLLKISASLMGHSINIVCWWFFCSVWQRRDTNTLLASLSSNSNEKKK